MRLAFLCVVALASPSLLQADHLKLTTASATYFSHTQTLEIIATFNRPFSLANEDWLSFSGWRTAAGVELWPPIESFNLRSDGRVGLEVREPFHIEHLEYENRRIVERDAMGLPDVSFDGHTFRATMPFSITGLESPAFNFEVSAHQKSDSGLFGSVLAGASSIDQRIVYTPEPSSVALASLGVVLFGVHRLRRKRPCAD